jgi:type I restriction enzyme, S subunit
MSEWSSVRLADVADIRFSNVDKKTIPGESAVRLCNYMDVYGNDYITADLPFMEASATHAEIARFGIGPGDVMITKDSETPDDIGISAVVTEEIENLVCGYHLALIKPVKAKIDPFYLGKQLRTAETVRYFGQRANGSTRYGLSSSAIANIVIPLAPLPQQRRIAEILGTVDEAIEQTEALIAKQQQVKAGLMHDLFTRGVTATGTLRPPPAATPHLYQESPLGWIPKEWEVLECSEICDKITVGIVVRPTQYYVNEGIPAFRSANVRETGIDPVDLVFISRAANELLAKSQLKAGDVVSVRTGYPGTSAVVPSEFEGANCIDILISRPTNRINPHFMAAWINSSFGKDQVLKKQGGLAQQHFNVGDLRKLRFVVPKEEEQTAIVGRLSAANHRIGTEIAFLAKLRQQKQGLMQDLLTGCVPVPAGE